jgi:hypothetical protein
MLKFFKRIRKRQIHQGRLKNYLLYAVGEIILVVIGILLALQINNWNTERVEQDQMQEFASAMIQDLRADIYETELRQRQMEKIIMRMDSARTLINESKISDLQNIDLLCLTWNLYYRPFQWKRKTMEQLKSSASLRFIRNDSLLELIGEYDSFTQHLDEDFQGDLTRVERIEPLILGVVNMNYSNITDMRVGLLRTISDESKNNFYFFDHPEFREAQNQRIPLLTLKQEDLDLLINNLISLQFQYEIRANLEMNKLKSDAENLIVLLTEEYQLENMDAESANLN